jgi:hypothetical protein
MSDKLIAVLEQQTEILKGLAAQNKAGGMHVKTPASAPTYTELHGVGSLFGNQPIERDVISAHIRPTGVAASIPSFASVFEQPYYAALTGYTATNGAEATNPCDDNPAGFVKACNLTAQFGRVARDSQTIEINKVMLRANRGDFTDLRLRGEVLGGIGQPLVPGGLTSDGILNIVTKSEMVTMGVAMERVLGTMLWTGTPANNTAGGGYKEFPGLDNQVTTGQVDAETGQACPALDSDIKDFNYNDVDGTTLDIVEYLSMLEFYLRWNASQMGLDPVEWIVVMRPELWFELSAVWPCSYLSHRCQTVTGSNSGANPVVINDNVNVSMRDAMRNGRYIDINGNRYPVIVDTGIFENNNINNANCAAGEYASDIYFLPLKITGNFPVLYWEHVDYRAAGSDMALLNGKEDFWTDDGRFFWAIENLKWCYKLSVKTEPRIVLRTPQLAGRIQNVKYTPLQHLRSPDPASPYHFDGGVSQRADQTFNAVWA